MSKNAVCPGIWVAVDVGGPEFSLYLTSRSTACRPKSRSIRLVCGNLILGPRRLPLEIASVRCICKDVQIVLF
jgi:hypothetical protein